MPCYHHSFDLLDSFKRNADRDQHGRSADIQVVDLEYEGQNQRDRCRSRRYSVHTEQGETDDGRQSL